MMRSSVQMSAPESEVVHGYRVKKLPMLPYFQAMEALGAFNKAAAPERAAALVETLLGLKKGSLEKDSRIGVTELMDLVAAWSRLNDFTEFFQKQATKPTGKNDEGWLQKCIANGLKMGIGKRELLYDYYPDEFFQVMAARQARETVETVEAGTPYAFFA